MRAALIGTGIAALLLAGASSGVQPGPSRITITDRTVAERPMPTGRVLKTLLYNRGISPNPIGNSVLVCHEIGAGIGPIPPGAFECIGTYRFAHGNVQVSGYMGRPGLYTLSVTGGTGIYSNSGAGQMAAVTINVSPREQQLTFTLYST